MKKILWLILLLLLVGLSWFFFFQEKNTETPPLELPEKTVHFPKFGLAFDYDHETMTLINQENQTKGDQVFQVNLFTTSEYEALLQSDIPREGPPGISVEVYRNPMSLDKRTWILQNPAPNFDPAKSDDLINVYIGAENYDSYFWDGLYRARTLVTEKNGYLYLLTTTYLSETDSHLESFEEILLSLTLTTPTIPAQTAHGDIQLDSPKPGEIITSPLTVTGKARGYWFFEATAPLILTDWDGKIIAQAYIEATEPWMTEEFVPFTGSITFETPEYGERGTLILQKQNASGLPEHADAIEASILFSPIEL